MAHLLEVAEEVVEKIYRFEEVLEMPVGSEAHAQHARFTLQSSQLYGHLTEADCDAIVTHDNCSWRGRFYTHYHVRGRCRSGCNDAADGLKIAKRLTRMSLGKGCPEPLLFG